MKQSCRSALAAVIVLAAFVPVGARAADYLKMDVQAAMLSPVPLGPPAYFTVPVTEPPPDARAEAAPAERQAAVAPVRQASRGHIREPRVREAKVRRRSNPLDAFATMPAPRVHSCVAGKVCVFDGKLNRWRAP